MEDKQVVAVTPRTARRSFSKQFKRELVRQALLPDVSRAALALANGINANQLARWCREHFRSESLVNATRLVAVSVAESAISHGEPVRPTAAPLGEIEWRHADTCVIVRGNIHPEALRVIIGQTLASSRAA